jgi:hypothetical protein
LATATVAARSTGDPRPFDDARLASTLGIATAGLAAVGGDPAPVGEVSPSVGEVPPSVGEVPPSLGEDPPSVGEVSPALGEVTPSVGGRSAEPGS